MVPGVRARAPRQLARGAAARRTRSSSRYMTCTAALPPGPTEAALFAHSVPLCPGPTEVAQLGGRGLHSFTFELSLSTFGTHISR